MQSAALVVLTGQTLFMNLRGTFWDAFSGIVISGEVKMMKPEPAVFEHLLATFSLRPEESVFIDDVLANIDAAKEMGLHTIWFKDAAQCRRELEQVLRLDQTLHLDQARRND